MCQLCHDVPWHVKCGDIATCLARKFNIFILSGWRVRRTSGRKVEAKSNDLLNNFFQCFCFYLHLDLHLDLYIPTPVIRPVMCAFVACPWHPNPAVLVLSTLRRPRQEIHWVYGASYVALFRTDCTIATFVNHQ